MVPSRVVSGVAQSSSSSGIFFQGDGQSHVVGNSHLSSNFVQSPHSLSGHAQGNVTSLPGDVSNTVLNSVVSSGPSVGASSLVTDANSGLSGGPHLQRSASFNTDSYMRSSASPMSFTSNNISITGSSVMDGSSVIPQSSNQEPGSQALQNQQLQGASSTASFPTSRMGQVHLKGGPRAPNSFIQEPAAISQLQKKPRLDIKQEDILQHQALQQILQKQDSMHLQNTSPQFQALIQQQRLRQQHQREWEQQQLLQSMPAMQRAQLMQQQQLRQQLLQQGLQPASGIKRPYDGGVCSRRLMQYLYHQRQRPADNTIVYWKKFVAEYYSPRAKKRWCLSLYDNVGHHSLGVFPQAAMDAWQCDICGSKSGRGFEATFEVLPRLNEIKFGSGVIDELLFLNLPRESRFPSGMMMLEYGKAVQESVYEQLRVVREGQLRIIFTADLKILSWEFCARRHEEILPRRLVAPQVNQLLQVAQKCQSTISESGPDGVSQPDIQANSVMVVTAGRQLARSLELQSLNDLGFSKRYVRCLQIAEVVNSMKDLMHFCKEQKTGPIEGLKNYPRHTTTPKIQSQEADRLGGDRNALNKLISSNPGSTSNNPNQQMVNRGSLTGSAQAALASSNYQNLLMRQNSMNSAHNSSQQQDAPSHSSQTPTTPGSSTVLPGNLQNSSVNGFSGRRHSSNGNVNGNGLLPQQHQSLQSQGSQAFQRQMMNNGAALPQQSVSSQNRGGGGDMSREGAAGAGHLSTSRSNSFNNTSSTDEKAPDFGQNQHLPEDFVGDIAGEFSVNGFFDNDLDDNMNFDWKA